MEKEELREKCPFKPEIREINWVLGTKDENSQQFVERLANEKLVKQRSMIELLPTPPKEKIVSRPIHSQLYKEAKIRQTKRDHALWKS